MKRVVLLLLLAPSVWAAMPPFAQELPQAEDTFEIRQGFPHRQREKELYERESERIARILPNGTRIAVGVYTSFDEFFYEKPLAIPPADAQEVRRLVALARLSQPGEAADRETYPRQAEYKLLWSENGQACNLHFYLSSHTITQFLGGADARPLLLDDELFDQLAAILHRYKIDYANTPPAPTVTPP